MDSLFDQFKMNVGKKPLFSDIIILGYYDGPTEGVCNLMETQSYYIFSLVYLNFANKERMFSLIEVSKKWIQANEKLLAEFRLGDFQSFNKMKAKLRTLYK